MFFRTFGTGSIKEYVACANVFLKVTEARKILSAGRAAIHRRLSEVGGKEEFDGRKCGQGVSREEIYV
jgi:hypothetical protein